MASRAVRSMSAIRLGVLNTAGIPSVAKVIACSCPTVKRCSPMVPILGDDFMPMAKMLVVIGLLESTQQEKVGTTTA